MYITWMGNAGFRIETGKDKILIDPFVELPGGENPNTLADFLDPEDEVVLVTHAHVDHLYYIPDILEQSDKSVFCTEAAARQIEQFAECGDHVAVLQIGEDYRIGDVKLHVWQGQHVRFDGRLIARTLMPHHLLHRVRNLPFLLWGLRTFHEEGETAAFELTAEGKRIMVMGSLGLAPDTKYRPGMDLLVLPYQGSSYLVKETAKILDRLQPKAVLLSHFDNAFPPISQTVDTRPLKAMMDRKYPQIRVVKPTAGKRIRF